MKLTSLLVPLSETMNEHVLHLHRPDRIEILCNTQKVLHGYNYFFPLINFSLFHLLFFEFFNNFLLSG